MGPCWVLLGMPKEIRPAAPEQWIAATKGKRQQPLGRVPIGRAWPTAIVRGVSISETRRYHRVARVSMKRPALVDQHVERMRLECSRTGIAR